MFRIILKNKQTIQCPATHMVATSLFRNQCLSKQLRASAVRRVVNNMTTAISNILGDSCKKESPTQIRRNKKFLSFSTRAGALSKEGHCVLRMSKCAH